MLLDILFEIIFIWLFQFKFSSNVNPRKLNSLTLSITLSFIFRYRRLIFLWGVWNIMYLHLLIFKDSLLHFNQSFIFISYILILSSILSCFFLIRTISKVVDKVVSSTYTTKLKRYQPDSWNLAESGSFWYYNLGYHLHCQPSKRWHAALDIGEW